MCEVRYFDGVRRELAVLNRMQDGHGSRSLSVFNMSAERRKTFHVYHDNSSANKHHASPHIISVKFSTGAF